MFSRDLNPIRALRNANYLRIPHHHLASVKRFPLFTFPRSWNEEEEAKKYTHAYNIYSKQLHKKVGIGLASLVAESYYINIASSNLTPSFRYPR